jgi:hypothetical protein
MEPNGFAISTSPRTLGFSCSRVEPPLPMHMRCQSLVDRTPLLTREETFIDLTAPVRALPVYLHNYSQGCRSRSVSTPSASNLLARGLLLVYTPACRNKPRRPLAEHFARFRGCASSNPSGPSLSPRRATLALSASARAMVCSHLTTSKPSTKSSQCRLISSTAFSSTAFDVFYARLYCPLGGSAPNRRTSAPPVLHATFLHAIATSARRRPAPLTPRSIAGPSRSPAPRVSTFHRTPELRPRDGHRVPASRTIVLHHNSSCACHSRVSVTPPARAASTPAPARSCSRTPPAVRMLLLLQPSHSRARRQPHLQRPPRS